MTYASVRSQPNASPLPLPWPRSTRIGTSPPSASRALTRRRHRRRRAAPANTGTPSMSMRRRAGSSSTAPPRALPGLVRRGGRQPPAPSCDAKVRRCPTAAAMRPQFGSAPWTAALTRLLATTARATARASASSAAPLTWHVMRLVGALAVGGLLARQRARHGLDRAGERRRRVGSRRAAEPPRTRRRRPAGPCRSSTGRRPR